MTSGGNNFSRTFQDLKLQFPALFRTKVIFRDFPGPGILKKKKTELSRRRGWEPCQSDIKTNLHTTEATSKN